MSYQLPQQLWHQQWPFLQPQHAASLALVLQPQHVATLALVLQPQHAASLALVLQPQHAASLALVLQPMSTITKKSVKEGHAFYGREGDSSPRQPWHLRPLFHRQLSSAVRIRSISKKITKETSRKHGMRGAKPEARHQQRAPFEVTQNGVKRNEVIQIMIH